MVAGRVALGDVEAETTVELSSDVAVATWQAVGLAPLGPLDAQRILESDGADERLDMVLAMLADEASVLAKRLAGG